MQGRLFERIMRPSRGLMVYIFMYLARTSKYRMEGINTTQNIMYIPVWKCGHVNAPFCTVINLQTTGGCSQSHGDYFDFLSEALPPEILTTGSSFD